MSKNRFCKHPATTKTASTGEVNLFRCKNCGIIFSDRYKKGFKVKKIYKNYYRNEVAGRFLFGIEYIVKAFRFFRAFKIFTINPRGKRILDIGSGRGYMLYFLKKYYGFEDVVGTQIENNSYKFSKERLGLNIYNKDLLDIKFENGRFDMVTIWHVLEHVQKPERYLEGIYNILKEKGILVIEVPNYNSWSRFITGKYWLGLDLKHHLYFFNRDSLEKLLKRFGFRIKKVQTFSLEYSAFTSAQSLVSFLTRTNHLFFSWIQDGRYSSKLFINILLLLLLFPVCQLINFVLYFTNFGEIILVVAQKK